jgi:hypothetical protein
VEEELRESRIQKRLITMRNITSEFDKNKKYDIYRRAF